MVPSNRRFQPAGSLEPKRFVTRASAKPGRRGAATVEFAFIAPLVFLFVFVGIEFGRALMAFHGLEAAAREGCRTAISWQATTQDVENTVAERLGTFGISNYTLTIEPNPLSQAEQWEPVTVRIVVSYDDVSWLPTSRYLKGTMLSGSCTLPQESSPSGA